MTDPAEAWFLAACAWSQAALADAETCREEKLLEKAARADMRARELDPERAARSLAELEEQYRRRRSG